MSIYNLATNFLTEKLTPPELRLPIRLAWLRVLAAALQVKHNNIFGTSASFMNGHYTPAWDVSVTYPSGTYVKFGIARYQALVSNQGFVPTSSPTKWLLIETDYVGLNIRKQIYAGKMSLEYILNLYLNPSPAPTAFIYIATQGNANATFMLSNGPAPNLNYMPSSTTFQQYYLASVNAYTSGAVNYIIFVPLAVWNTLGTTTLDKDNVVRSIADRYNTAGMTYKIQTY